VTENTGAAAGTDMVNSSVTYSLLTNALNVENLTLTGSAAINATGNTLANIITGNSANNTLHGGTGIDTFVLLKTVGGLDTIDDFASNEKLDVRSFGIAAGFTVASGNGLGAATSTNNLLVFDSASKALYFDKVQIASLAGSAVTSLNASNFITV
jgi:hypothetical protein